MSATQAKPTVILDQIIAEIADVIRRANCWGLSGVQGGCWSVRVHPDGSITSDIAKGTGTISAAEFDGRKPHTVTVFQQVINPAFDEVEEYDDFVGDAVVPSEDDGVNEAEIQRRLEAAGLEVL